jgi:acylphosphatase
VSPPVARRLLVQGRVQGVFFRASTARRAEAAGVVGWVRNLPDGRVEAWVEGPRDAVDDVERWIRGGGPPAARVDGVVAADVEPAGHVRFEVRR